MSSQVILTGLLTVAVGAAVIFYFLKKGSSTTNVPSSPNKNNNNNNNATTTQRDVKVSSSSFSTTSTASSVVPSSSDPVPKTATSTPISQSSNASASVETAAQVYVEVKLPVSLSELEKNSTREVDLSEHYKDVKVGEGVSAIDFKVAVSRLADGRVFVTGNKCTHYAAPLAKGTLAGERLVCPWHAACFNVVTGDLEDGPGLDSIHTYAVRVDNDDVHVSLPPVPPSFKRQPKAGVCKTRAPKVAPKAEEKEEDKVAVVIGGGAAASAAVESLRFVRNFKGKITVISSEKYLPYDRVKLSKNFALKKADSILLRTADFYKSNGIEFIFDSAVTRVDFESRSVYYRPNSAQGQSAAPASSMEDEDDGATTTLKYDNLLVASGGVPRQVRCPGHTLKGIYTLRYPSDTAGIAETLDANLGEENRKKRVVIVGSSFIGMEAAACLKQTRSSQVESIVVIGMEKVPFERVLGADIGSFFHKLHLSKGIEFRMQRTVSKYIGSESVTAVELDDKEVLPADLVIVGAGIVPSTEFLRHLTPAPIGPDGSVWVDEHMRLKIGANGNVVPGVFAVGDIARFPFGKLTNDGHIRIEHWNVAQQQGRIAAENMFRENESDKTLEKFQTVPFFWTVQFGISLRYVGNAMTWDEIIIKGDIADIAAKKFVAYFVSSSKQADQTGTPFISACATLNADPIAVVVGELMRIERLPSPDDLREQPMDYILKFAKEQQQATA